MACAGPTRPSRTTAPRASTGDRHRRDVQRITGAAVTGDGWPVPFAVVTVIGAGGTQIGRTLRIEIDIEAVRA